MKRLLKAGADPNGARWDGETTLMIAAEAGSVEVVEMLIAQGADVNAVESRKGQTALMWAAAENYSDVVHALAALGAEINARSRVVAAPELEFPKSGGPNMPFARGGWTALARSGRLPRAGVVKAPCGH